MAPLTDLDEANSTIVELRQEIERLRAQLQLAQGRAFGKSRERIDPNQLLLFEEAAERLRRLEEAAQAEKNTPPAQEKKSKKKPGHGRGAFSEHLPREQIELDLPESERCCPDCGEKMHRIGVDVTERGHIIPARLMVKQYLRIKYGCRHGHAVRSAEMPLGVVDKAKYEPSVYAHLVTAKYCDHLPLHRLQGIFRRFGVRLPKQTMWDMLARFDEIAAQPILHEMRRQLLEEEVLQADETPIQVQLEGQKGTRRGALWAWRSVRGSANEMVLADFRNDRSAKGPDAFLGEWTGTLLTDGYDGVNPRARANDITRAGCWAHARRKFRDALATGEQRAGLVLRPIQRLFWIERAVNQRAEHRDFDRSKLIELRQRTRDHSSVLIQGPPGVGKTHLATALGVKAIENGFSAAFFRLDELLAALRTDAEHSPASMRRKKYVNVALLIIDEVGFEPMTRQEASLFFRLISYRYGRGSVMLTTNKGIKDWPELFAGDEVLATAILDRLLHKSHVLNIKGRSYRLRDLEHDVAARG